MPKRDAKRVRKPLGRVWCGNWLLPDDLLKSYGLRNLKGLQAYLGKIIVWSEQEAKRGED